MSFSDMEKELNNKVSTILNIRNNNNILIFTKISDYALTNVLYRAKNTKNLNKHINTKLQIKIVLCFG